MGRKAKIGVEGDTKSNTDPSIQPVRGTGPVIPEKLQVAILPGHSQHGPAVRNPVKPLITQAEAYAILTGKTGENRQDEKDRDEIPEEPPVDPETLRYHIDPSLLKEWFIELRIYERVYQSEIPFPFPFEWFKDEYTGVMAKISSVNTVINEGLPVLDPGSPKLSLAAGYKSFTLTSTEEVFEKFMDWCVSFGPIKVIGTTKISY